MRLIGRLTDVILNLTAVVIHDWTVKHHACHRVIRSLTMHSIRAVRYERCGSAGTGSNGGQSVIADEIRGPGARPYKEDHGPTLIGAWNWLGIISHGGWFVLLPAVELVPLELRTWTLTGLAIPLLLGHLHLFQARLIKRRRGAG